VVASTVVFVPVLLLTDILPTFMPCEGVSGILVVGW
jgi:hypothetical protein